MPRALFQSTDQLRFRFRPRALAAECCYSIEFWGFSEDFWPSWNVKRGEKRRLCLSEERIAPVCGLCVFHEHGRPRVRGACWSTDFSLRGTRIEHIALFRYSRPATPFDTGQISSDVLYIWYHELHIHCRFLVRRLVITYEVQGPLLAVFLRERANLSGYSPPALTSLMPTLPWVRFRCWVRVGLWLGLASREGWVGTWPATKLDPIAHSGTYKRSLHHVFIQTFIHR